MTAENMIRAIRRDDIAEGRKIQAEYALVGYESLYENHNHVYIFHEAVNLNRPAFVEMFLQGDVYDGVLREKYGHMLATAVQQSFYEIAEIMVAHGFDPASKNGGGVSPVGLAHRKGDQRMMDILARAPTVGEASGWKQLDVDRIAHIANDRAIGHYITTIFNFATRERVTVVRNTATEVETHDVKSFAQLDDRLQLENAASELCRLTGRSEAAVLGRVLPKQTLSLPGK